MAEEAIDGRIAQYIGKDVCAEEFGFEPCGVVLVVKCLVVLSNLPFGVVGDHLGAELCMNCKAQISVLICVLICVCCGGDICGGKYGGCYCGMCCCCLLFLLLVNSFVKNDLCFVLIHLHSQAIDCEVEGLCG